MSDLKCDTMSVAADCSNEVSAVTPNSLTISLSHSEYESPVVFGSPSRRYLENSRKGHTRRKKKSAPWPNQAKACAHTRVVFIMRKNKLESQKIPAVLAVFRSQFRLFSCKAASQRFQRHHIHFAHALSTVNHQRPSGLPRAWVRHI